MHQTEEWTLESQSFVRSMLDAAERHGAVAPCGTEVGHVVVTEGIVGQPCAGMGWRGRTGSGEPAAPTASSATKRERPPA